MSSASRDIMYSELVGRLIFRAARRNFPLSTSKTTTISVKEYCRLQSQHGNEIDNAEKAPIFSAVQISVLCYRPFPWGKGKILNWFSVILRGWRLESAFPCPWISTLHKQALIPFPFFYGQCSTQTYHSVVSYLLKLSMDMECRWKWLMCDKLIIPSNGNFINLYRIFEKKKNTTYSSVRSILWLLS